MVSNFDADFVSLSQASPIMIGGRQAFVEEKRATGSRGKFDDPQIPILLYS